MGKTQFIYVKNHELHELHEFVFAVKGVANSCNSCNSWLKSWEIKGLS